MQPTTIRLPGELVETLDRLAARESRSRTGQALHLIRRGLVAEGYPDPLDGDDGPGGAVAVSSEPRPRRSGETPVPAPNRAEAA